MQTVRSRDVAGTCAALLLAVLLAACATTSGPRPSVLDEARAALDAARATPNVTRHAAVELDAAAKAYQQADALFRRQGDTPEVRSLAYLARERVAIARATGDRIAAEQATAVADAEAARSRAARESAQSQAQAVQAADAQREAKAAEERAEAARAAAREAEASAALARRQAAEAASARQAASMPDYRHEKFDVVMRELVATRTDRGIVVTMNEVLFDTDGATLRPGGMRLLARLGALLRDHPDRVLAIEGFTDTAGDDAQNKALSEERAAAVREALVDAGVASGRIVSRGYGEAFPIASNESPEGRVRNRRVEIVIGSGAEVTPRVARAGVAR